MILFRWLIAILFVARTAAAGACSMDPEWIKPSNFELVEMSDAIVVATPTLIADNKLRWRVTDVLSGKPPEQYETSGYLTVTDPSDPSDFKSAHPNAYSGGCSRYEFSPGKPVLTMLSRLENGTWMPIPTAFSRTEEDYGGPTNPWTILVRRYIDLVSAMRPVERHRALQQMARTGVDQHGKRLSPAEVADIRDHLSSLSPYKPTEVLLAAYETLEKGQRPKDGVRSRDADREGGLADAVTNLMFGDQLPPSGPDHAAMKTHVLTSLVNGEHPKAMPLFRQLFAEASAERNVGVLAPALRFLAKNGAYDEAFGWVEANLFSLLSSLPQKDQKRLVSAVADLQAGDDYENQRWKNSPRARAMWPEMALRLWHWQVKHWGRDEALPFSDAISSIKITDYRRRPDLTLALAADYNSGALDWARKSLDTAGSASEVRLPLQLIVQAWTAEHRATLEAEFCRAAPRRLQLIELLGREGDSLYESVLLRIAASRLSTAERRALRVAYRRWKQRFEEEPSLPNAAPGTKVPKTEPIRCKPSDTIPRPSMN